MNKVIGGGGPLSSPSPPVRRKHGTAVSPAFYGRYLALVGDGSIEQGRRAALGLLNAVAVQKNALKPSGFSPLARNAGALYLAHAAGLVAPLLTIPFLARVLQPEGWGLVVLAQSFGAWSALILEYAFDLSGTRGVARLRGEPAQLSLFVSGVQGARLLVLLLAVPVIMVLWLTLHLQPLQERIFLWAWLFAVFKGLTPSWYFFGLERMVRPAILEAAGRVIPALAVFLSIRGPGDEWKVMALQATGAAAVLFVLTGEMYEEVPFRRPTWKGALRALREGAGAFLLRSASGLYLQANGLILGILSTPQTVAFFGGAERVIRGAINLFQPLSQVLFPRSSHLLSTDLRAAGSFLRLSLFIYLIQGALMMIVALSAAPWLVRVILGPGYEDAIPVLRVLAGLPPVIAVGTALGTQWALAAGRERPLVLLVLLAGAANLAMAVLLVPRFGAAGMAVSVLSAEVMVACGLVLMFRQAGGRFRPFTPPRSNP